MALKGNQGTLNEDVHQIFEDLNLRKKVKLESAETLDGEHGRIETRIYTLIACPEILKKQHNWPFLESLIEVKSIREIKEKRAAETRYYITSLTPDPKKIAPAIRAHWSLENRLHWILDISFRDDESGVRKGNAPQNMAIIKHTTLNLLQEAKGKGNYIKRLRKAAGWDNARLLVILSTHF